MSSCFRSHFQTTSLEQSLSSALAVHVAPAEPANPGGLSATEAQVLRLLAKGRTIREIAAELVIAISTADRYLTHIYDKLGVRNRAEAVVLALKYGVTLREFPHLSQSWFGQSLPSNWPAGSRMTST